MTVWPARTNYLWTIPLMSKKTLSMVLTLLFTCLAFSVCPKLSTSFKHLCTTQAFFPKCLSNHCQRLCHTFFEIYTKFDAHSLLDPTHKAWYTTPKLKDLKNQHVHPAAWNVVHLFPTFASIIIYRCITLLQLLYRWQHQSQK
jgi:hypothetical protein